MDKLELANIEDYNRIFTIFSKMLNRHYSFTYISKHYSKILAISIF